MIDVGFVNCLKPYQNFDSISCFRETKSHSTSYQNSDTTGNHISSRTHRYHNFDKSVIDKRFESLHGKLVFSKSPECRFI